MRKITKDDRIEALCKEANRLAAAHGWSAKHVRDAVLDTADAPWQKAYDTERLLCLSDNVLRIAQEGAASAPIRPLAEWVLRAASMRVGTKWEYSNSSAKAAALEFECAPDAVVHDKGPEPEAPAPESPVVFYTAEAYNEEVARRQTAERSVAILTHAVRMVAEGQHIPEGFLTALLLGLEK